MLQQKIGQILAQKVSQKLLFFWMRPWPPGSCVKVDNEMKSVKHEGFTPKGGE